jgi:hypothetical protein
LRPSPPASLAAAALVFTLAAALPGCESVAPEPPGAPPLGPPLDGEFRPEDPRWKRVFVAESDDGLSWSSRGEPLVELASSPQLVRIAGQLRVYYVHHGSSIAWVPLEGGEARGVEIEGLDGGLQVDPCLVASPDGGHRLYLVHHPDAADPGLGRHNRILSAHSGDAERWSLEPGVRLEGGWVDPDVVPLPEGGLRMFLTRNTREVASARSTDGLDFALEDGLRFQGGGVTSTLQASEGWWMYYHESGTLWRAWSSDGERFEAPRRLELAPPDDSPWMLESPSVLQDGARWVMVYVVAPTEPGQVRGTD